jgi:hypothetical protein
LFFVSHRPRGTAKHKNKVISPDLLQQVGGTNPRVMINTAKYGGFFDENYLNGTKRRQK